MSTACSQNLFVLETESLLENQEIGHFDAANCFYTREDCLRGDTGGLSLQTVPEDFDSISIL